MMHIYTNDAHGRFVRADVIPQCGWIQLQNPTPEELYEVASATRLPFAFLEDALQPEERPRVERQGQASLVLLHEPCRDERVSAIHEDVKYRSLPLGIIVTGDLIVTVSRQASVISPDFMVRHGLRLAPGRQSFNALAMAEGIAQAFAGVMQDIDADIASAEAELARSYRNRELYALLYLNESLIYMTTALKNMMHVMHRIRQDEYLPLTPEDLGMFEAAVAELDQAHAVTHISQLNLNNVMDAYGNIIQNNVSHIVKFLTAVTIVLSIPTLIASIYGMNVPLPFQTDPSAFTVIVISMVVISGMVAWLFQKKRYF
ncbi:magnesium transporter CorA family protein [Kerstersia sp.]|uniref:magnesium transporter CorA family protein n=1 Tax=Kerstersia sp. TaxID=1930783 RepID=UPI003F908830